MPEIEHSREHSSKVYDSTVWSILAIAAGSAGIAHIGPIFYRLPIDDLLESVAFITTMMFMLVITAAGVTASAISLKRRARWSRPACATSATGMLIIIVILVKYQSAWGWAVAS
jgi:hypothetical protein